MSIRAFAAVLVLSAGGCSSLLTETPPEGDDSETPLEGLSPEELATFAAGDETFERQFSAADGLGPTFNQVSCGACHVGDGAGHPDNVLVRYSRAGDPLFGLGGPQLQDRAIPGVEPEALPSNVQTSRRVPPVVHGMGLIEAIPAAAILANADPDDDDEDGISGRPNCIALFPPADPSIPVIAELIASSAEVCDAGLVAGRFGWKANNATLAGQVATAYQQDMGITNPLLPTEPNSAAFAGAVPGDLVADPEIDTDDLQLTTAYVRMLAPPRSEANDEDVAQGSALFDELGCASCHIRELRTSGDSAVAAIRDRSVPLYSDLLLHDMGQELADARVDGSADGREWRTPPLWGLRIKGDNLGGTPFYLHDGRTSDLGEAIELHGGEAEASRDAYRAASDADRNALHDFLRSL